MVRVGVVFSPPWVVLGGALLISLCWMCANHHGRTGFARDHSLESDSLVTWRDAVGRIHRRSAHVRTRRIVLSTEGEGIGSAGGVHDVVLHPQSRNSFGAGKRSVISTRRLWPFPAEGK